MRQRWLSARGCALCGRGDGVRTGAAEAGLAVIFRGRGCLAGYWGLLAPGLQRGYSQATEGLPRGRPVGGLWRSRAVVRSRAEWSQRVLCLVSGMTVD